MLLQVCFLHLGFIIFLCKSSMNECIDEWMNEWMGIWDLDGILWNSCVIAAMTFNEDFFFFQKIKN
jgi:hypothetical protein